MRQEQYRKQPVQQRGQDRIRRILDAADSLLAESGYDAMTTNAIAVRAETSIGSLYQFFNDKQAVANALADRYLARLKDVHEKVMTPDVALLPLAEVYDRILRALADFHKTNPGFRPLFHGSANAAGLAESAAMLNGECAQRVEVMLAAAMPRLPAPRRQLLALMNVEVIKALLPLSESGDEAMREYVLGEIKRLLLAYMRMVEADLEQGDPA